MGNRQKEKEKEEEEEEEEDEGEEKEACDQSVFGKRVPVQAATQTFSDC